MQAIATNDWDAFYAHVVEFQNEHDLKGKTGIAIGENLVKCPTCWTLTPKINFFLINPHVKPAPEV